VNGDRVPLEASRPARAAGLQNCADPPPSQPVHATILLRRQAPAAPHLNAILAGAARPMSREEAAKLLGADPAQLELVEGFARSHGLEVTESSAAQRSVKVAGTVAQMEAAFGVKLRQLKSGDKCYLYYDEPLTVPSSLAAIIEGVLGLDGRPIAGPR
jgi:kumamolisin